MKPGKSAGNLKHRFWKGSSGKTVVEVRCCGAHRGCMWLMHRYKGHFSLDGARGSGRLPSTLCPSRLGSSGERAAGDAAGGHVWAPSWTCPRARQRLVCAARLLSPPLVSARCLHARGPCQNATFHSYNYRNVNMT